MTFGHRIEKDEVCGRQSSWSTVISPVVFDKLNRNLVR